MTIKFKLTIGFAIIIVSIFLSSVFGWYAMRQMASQTNQIVYLDEASKNALLGNNAIWRYSTTSNPEDAKQAGIALAAVIQNFKEAEPYIVLPEQKQRLQAVLQEMAQGKQAFDLVEENTRIVQTQVQTIAESQKAAFSSLAEAISRTENMLRAAWDSRRFEGSIQLQNANGYLLRSNMYIKTFHENPTAENAEAVQKLLRDALASMDKALENLAISETVENIRVARTNIDNFSAAFTQYALAKQNLDKAQTAVEERVGSLVSSINAMVNHAVTRLTVLKDSGELNTFIMGMLAIIASVLIAIATVLSISRPMKQAQNFADKVASGDFNARWQSTHTDEFGTLAHTINRAFDKVAEKNVWFESVLNSLPFLLATMDNERKFTFANTNVLNMLGKKLDQIKGQPCHTWGASICQTENCAIECCHKGIDSVNFVQPGLGDFRAMAVQLKDTHGSAIGYVDMVFDINEEVRLQKEAEEAGKHARMEVVNALEGIVERFSTAAEELSAQIEQSDRGAMETAQRMGETATAMEEMNSTVMEVAHNAGDASSAAHNMYSKAQEGASIVNEVVQGMGTLHKTASDMRGDMEALDARAEGIGLVMTTIADIADQTNLLALNAAIEAARAGEAGRGFAVVADEVRKLAEKTQHATAEVGKAIGEIQKAARQSRDNVENAVNAIAYNNTLSVQSGQSLEEILHVAEAAADKVRAIATAAEQQSATSEEINHTIEGVTTIANELSTAMSEANSAVTDLASQAANLRNIINKMRDA